jgi:hypothetical protein
VHLKFFGESARVGVVIVLRYEVPSDHVRVTKLILECRLYDRIDMFPFIRTTMKCQRV